MNASGLTDIMYSPLPFHVYIENMTCMPVSLDKFMISTFAVSTIACIAHTPDNGTYMLEDFAHSSASSNKTKMERIINTFH